VRNSFSFTDGDVGDFKIPDASIMAIFRCVTLGNFHQVENCGSEQAGLPVTPINGLNPNAERIVLVSNVLRHTEGKR
jgi:hypothetical protein